MEEDGFRSVFKELQLEGSKGAEKTCFEGFDAYDVVLIGESFDDLGVVVCEDFVDIALGERGSNRIAGFVERLSLGGRALKLVAGWLRLSFAGGKQNGGRGTTGGGEQLSPVHSASIFA